MSEAVATWQGLSADERVLRLAEITPATDRVEAVLSWVAQCIGCWQEDNAAGCDAALLEAEKIASDSGDFSLQELVVQCRDQLNAAASKSSQRSPELSAVLEQLEQGKPAAAQPLLQQALERARAANDSQDIAICQFYVGQVLLMQENPSDAVTALREALELATQLGETELLQAVQQVLTVAVQLRDQS